MVNSRDEVDHYRAVRKNDDSRMDDPQITIYQDEPEKKPARPLSALNSTVVRLGLVALFADISSEMLYPITPIFLTSVLAASYTSVGIIEGVAEGLASLLKIFGRSR